VNFFGHAAVASWRTADSAFVLGAMLPDFAAMIRSRPPRVSRDGIDRGIAFHHQTDRVFHRAPTFAALESDARRALAAAGVRRGTALAVAHVGVEILLDVVVARDDGAARAYRRALTDAGPSALGAHVHWDDPPAATRYARLIDVLAERSHPDAHLSADIVTWRLERALAGRPRLALSAEDLPRVQRWVAEARDAIEARAPALLAEVRSGLGL
jgi:hypothetical protein